MESDCLEKEDVPLKEEKLGEGHLVSSSGFSEYVPQSK